MKIKYLTLVGAAFALTITSSAAVAQSTSGSSTTNESSEIKLSPQGLEILCERFPLNSRCQGNAATPAGVVPSESGPETPPADPAVDRTVAPETIDDPVDANTTPGTVPGTTTSPGNTTTPDGTMNMPGGTTAPSGAIETPSTPSTPPAEGATTGTGNNIVALAAANDSFETLTAALKAAGLTETLSGTGPFTVFAPTDEAFAALPQDALQELLKPENKAILVKILTYHVVPGQVTSTQLKSGEVRTVEGGEVNVKVDPATGVTVNDAKVVQPDIQASNGVIHVIDKVILPPDI